MKYGIVKSLYCTPATNIALYINWNLDKKLKEKKSRVHPYIDDSHKNFITQKKIRAKEMKKEYEV